MWQYMEVIRLAAEPRCAYHLENTIQTIDDILSRRFSRSLKSLFGLADLTHDEDFAALISVYVSSLL